MLKNIFNLFYISGVIIIGILSFIIPSDPYVMLPGLLYFEFDKPLWLVLIIVFSFFYLMILIALYNQLEKNKICN